MPFKALNKRDLTLLTKSKRSQSALEYMMTYGWAILIIVIVAVILYSMGIFNPSSSITTTITGFQKTPISSAIFTDNGGLSLSVQNSVGYPIKITNITATTLTGGKVIIEPNITLLPGKSQVLVLSKVFTAANQGSHISTAVTITYKEISQQLPGPYISTGSITGSTPTVIYPANYTFAAVSKLTITNKQSSATPSPFQQMVNITSADNGWQLISNGNFGQNVEFFYSNGTVIPSWLESYTGSNAIWWLKLGSIPAGSSITVYMGIASTSTNLFNTVNDGEAPQIPCGSTPTSSCSNYAEYDDGVNVFNNYWNFAGTSLPSGLTTFGQSEGATVDNKLTLTWSTIDATGVYVINGITAPQIVEALSLSSYSTTFPTMIIGESTGVSSGTSGEGGWLYPSYDIDYYEGYWRIEYATSSTRGAVSSATANVQKTVYSFVWVSTGNERGYQNYNNFVSSLDTTNTWASRLYPYIGIDDAGLGSFSIQWLRTRAYPPNGIMPSISFGSVA